MFSKKSGYSALFAFIKEEKCMSFICHASIDEKGYTIGGKLGDQNGKEVFERIWYKRNWHYLLRPKNKKIAEKAVDISLRLANNPNVGYDQSKRNTLLAELEEHSYDPDAVGPCATDCSAFVTACYIAAGCYALKTEGNSPTTSNMIKVFSKSNQFHVLTSAEYLRVDAKLLPGDILLQPGHHTVIVTKVVNPYKESDNLIKIKTKGEGVRWLQWMLVRFGYLDWDQVDGEFGKKTLRATISFQKDNDLEKDGVVGPLTKAKILERMRNSV
jgi:peptidoglycan hydrolase-like protein with peptidoglycan-binding domain